MIEKKIYRMTHIYITAFHVDFVRIECRVRRECRHSVELRQCAERCATEIKVGHHNQFKSKKCRVSFAVEYILFGLVSNVSLLVYLGETKSLENKLVSIKCNLVGNIQLISDKYITCLEEKKY